MKVDLASKLTQEQFGALVGISQPTVSCLIATGVLMRDATGGEWLAAYCGRLREQAAGRLGAEVGGLDLVQERAALARSQRIAQDMKNAVARGEFAPIGLLADVLGMASSAVVDRFDQLERSLRKSCPSIEDDVMATVLAVVASARNEWIRSTQRQVFDRLDAITSDEDPSDSDVPADDEGAES